MTDNIVYIGSANYSEESAKNVEFGFISQDKSLIDYINSFILPDIRSTAVPYYEYDYTSLLLEANMLLAAIHAAKNELYEETHRFYDDIEGHGYYYASTEATLSVETLDKISPDPALSIVVCVLTCVTFLPLIPSPFIILMTFKNLIFFSLLSLGGVTRRHKYLLISLLSTLKIRVKVLGIP